LQVLSPPSNVPDNCLQQVDSVGCASELNTELLYTRYRSVHINVLKLTAQKTQRKQGKHIPQMKPTWLYRIAAILFVLFATLHTIGFLKFVPPTPEGQAVMNAMNTVPLQPGHNYTYGNFYRGFGLFATVYFLFAAAVAWHLGELSRKLPAALGSLPWIFFALQLIGLALTWKYFSKPPVVFSALVTFCIGWAAILARPASAPASPERS
jgi:hypothetical protein